MNWALGGQEVQSQWDGTNRWEKPTHTARPRKGQVPSSRTQYQNKYASLQNEGKTPQGSRGTNGNQHIAQEEWDKMSPGEKEREKDRQKIIKGEKEREKDRQKIIKAEQYLEWLKKREEASLAATQPREQPAGPMEAEATAMKTNDAPAVQAALPNGSVKEMREMGKRLITTPPRHGPGTWSKSAVVGKEYH